MTPRNDLIARLNQLALDMSRAERALNEMATTRGVKDAAELLNFSQQAGRATARIYEWAQTVKQGG